MLSLGASPSPRRGCLLGFAVLPVLWWLLRVTPPAPRRMRFPGAPAAARPDAARGDAGEDAAAGSSCCAWLLAALDHPRRWPIRCSIPTRAARRQRAAGARRSTMAGRRRALGRAPRRARRELHRPGRARGPPRRAARHRAAAGRRARRRRSRCCAPPMRAPRPKRWRRSPGRRIARAALDRLAQLDLAGAADVGVAQRRHRRAAMPRLRRAARSVSARLRVLRRRGRRRCRGCSRPAMPTTRISTVAVRRADARAPARDRACARSATTAGCWRAQR